MSQHDFIVSGDQLFPDYVTDLNNAIAALVSNSSGNTEPSPTYAGQIWLDTSVNPASVKIRNIANSGWVTLGTLSSYLGITPSQLGTLTTAEINNAIAAALIPYLTQSAASSTYLTQASAASTYAPLNAPALTGNATSQTPTTNDDSLRIANTSWVRTVLNGESWINSSFFNNWENFGGAYQTLQYRKINNLVYIRGLIKKTTDFTANTIFFLPTGYRPPSDLFISTNVGSNTTTGTGNLIIQASNGNVALASVGYGMTGTSFAFLGLNLSFSIN